MTKNPFLKRRAPPPPLARETPFLSQPQDRCAYTTDRCAYNLFSGSHATIIKTTAIMPPPPLLTFEEAFPSLSKSSQQQSQQQSQQHQQSQQQSHHMMSPLNFKLAIQKNAPRSEAPRSEAPRSEAPRSEATQFMRGNMFLFPQSRCVPHHRDRDDDRDYDDRDYDDRDYDNRQDTDAPAYDSEYTQYYDHRR